MTVKKIMQTSEGKKNCSSLIFLCTFVVKSIAEFCHACNEFNNIVPNKKGDIGMEVYYPCQPNTYVTAITAAHQIHEQ